MNNGTIDLQRNGFIATLVINRPAKLNALTPEMLEQLLAHCHTLETDSEIRVVLLTSASEKAFCVGADIHQRTDRFARTVDSVRLEQLTDLIEQHNRDTFHIIADRKRADRRHAHQEGFVEPLALQDIADRAVNDFPAD